MRAKSRPGTLASRCARPGRDVLLYANPAVGGARGRGPRREKRPAPPERGRSSTTPMAGSNLEVRAWRDHRAAVVRGVAVRDVGEVAPLELVPLAPLHVAVRPQDVDPVVV